MKSNKKVKETAGTGMEIAVIGMAGRFPGARNIEQLWHNLRDGMEPVSFFSDEELAEAGVAAETMKQPQYVRGKSFLEDKGCFDAQFFGYTPPEAGLMNPQMRIFHECTYHALEDAGYNPEEYDGLIGIYSGASQSFFWEVFSHLSGKRHEVGQLDSMFLTVKDFINAKAAYNLDLKGPVFSVNTACSTSLVAIHLACRALLTGECKMALAGGVTVMNYPAKGYIYREGMHLSADGHCRAFDSRAKGMIEGEGVGLVVLKRLQNALTDGDYIYAVVKGSAINNDGRRKVAYSAPSIEGQAEVIRRALRNSRVEPESIGYVETHGTGTDLGDPVEMAALKLAFNTEKTGYCAVGSVKSNFGHLDAAAGVTGFIKAVLALYHGIIPPSLHFETPNPEVDFENSPFYVNTVLKEWSRREGNRRAGVSSFGMGGTNVHVVLEEYKSEIRNSKSETNSNDQNSNALNKPLSKVLRGPGAVFQKIPWLPEARGELVVLSAKTGTALERMTLNLGDYLKRNACLDLRDVAYTLQVGRKEMPYRRMLLSSDTAGAAAELGMPGSRKLKSFHSKAGKRTIIFMFSGLGSQYVNMGADLYRSEPVFREEMDRCFDILRPILDYDLKEILYPSLDPGSAGKTDEADRSNRTGSPDMDNRTGIDSIENAQLVVFILEYALARLLIKWGVEPHALIGYSFGEYTAACISGVLSLEDALALVAARGRLLRDQAAGAMLSVPVSSEELTGLLPANLSLAIDNGSSCVVAGSEEAVAAFEERMKEKRCLCIRLQADRALHSPIMTPAAEELSRIAGRFKFSEPRIPYISNVTGDWIRGEEAVDASYWAKHLGQKVCFAQGIRRLVQEEKAVFIEIGPGKELRSLMMRYIEENPAHRALHLIRPNGKQASDVHFLLDKIGKLWLYGVKIDWHECFPGEGKKRVPLPGYPFDKKSFPAAFDLSGMISELQQPFARPVRQEPADWFYIPSWERALPEPVQPPGKREQERCCWLVFSDEQGLADRLVKQVKQRDLASGISIVKMGKEFSAEQDEFTVNPHRPNDYERLFKEVGKKNRVPGKILHFWGVGAGAGPAGIEDIDDSQERGMHSLLDIVREMGKQSLTGDTDIFVVTDNMQEVLGKDCRCPEKSTILGPVKVIPEEYHNINCRSIDIDGVLLQEPGEEGLDALISHLLAEFSIDDGQPVVAYRGDYRWVQTYRPLTLPEPGDDSPPIFKRKGVYLITGGMGGMGFSFAKHLAAGFAARLLLIGRSPFPSRADRQQWLEEHEKDDPVSLKIRKIMELEQEGAEILVANGDISDFDKMSEIIGEAVHRFGTIDGVLHTAGVIDYGGVIQRRTREMTDRGLAAKVRGTLVLDRVLKPYKLDFMVLFSTLGNVLYRRKFGQVAYSAANEFLDAFALYKTSLKGTYTVSINWTDWKEVGMAVEVSKQMHPGKGDDIDYDVLLPLAISPAEGIDVFNRVVANRLTRAVISTGNLIHELERQKNRQSKLKDADGAFEKEAAPEVVYERPDLSSDYAEPRNETERKLAQLFQTFFGMEKVGIHDDFFELGGDSLKAMTVVSRIHRKMNVEVPISEFFNRPVVEKLAQYIDGAGKSEFHSIQAVEKKEFYPLSPAQKRLYFLQYLDEESVSYNQVQALVLEGTCDSKLLEDTCRQLIRRHESLRTYFEMVADEPVQRVLEHPLFHIEIHAAGEEDVDRMIRDFTRPFDLNKAPLFRLEVIDLTEDKYILMYDLHHIISDGTSNTLFRQDFMMTVMGKELPLLPVQYSDYSHWLNDKKTGGFTDELEAYWLGEFAGELPVLTIPTDFSRPAVQSFKGKRKFFEIDKEETEMIRALAADQGVTVFMFMFAIYYILLARLSGQEDIIIGIPTAGRGHPDLENLMGMLVNTLAIRTYPEKQKTFIDFLKEVKEKTLKAFENQDYQFEDLVEKIALDRDVSRNPLFDVLFQFENIDVAAPGDEGVNVRMRSYGYESGISQFDIMLDGLESRGKIRFSLSFSIELFKEETIDRFIAFFKEITAAAVKNPGQRLSVIAAGGETQELEGASEFADNLELEFET